jgi:hypothetical protein
LVDLEVADQWREIPSCTILTCGPNAAMAELHDRMPVILAESDREDPATEEEWLAMLKPCPDEALKIWPVDKKVGNVRNRELNLRCRFSARCQSHASMLSAGTSHTLKSKKQFIRWRTDACGNRSWHCQVSFTLHPAAREKVDPSLIQTANIRSSAGAQSQT